jgi:hypothetical protein
MYGEARQLQIRWLCTVQSMPSAQVSVWLFAHG